MLNVLQLLWPEASNSQWYHDNTPDYVLPWYLSKHTHMAAKHAFERPKWKLLGTSIQAFDFSSAGVQLELPPRQVKVQPRLEGLPLVHPYISIQAESLSTSDMVP